MSGGPIIMQPVLLSILKELIGGSVINFKDTSIADAESEAEKQNISLQIAQQQARVTQEIAIALRTVTSDEVEIEEFYDNSGGGSAGLKGSKEGISLGISGNVRKITKRVYKFKGYNEKNIEMYEQKFNELVSKEADTKSEKTDEAT